MTALAPILGTLLLLQAQAPKKASPAAGVQGAATTPTAPSPGVAEGTPAAAKNTVILFLVDNSASLPPLDPTEQRVAALEKMFTFLKGQPYRLVLFGAKREISVDDPSQYDNRGQWTDLYFAFEKARELVAGYPPGTDFRLVLLTDAILDPDPAEWKDMDVPPGVDLKGHVRERVVDLVRELKLPLYVILVGNAPKEGDVPRDQEQSPGLILEMVRAANGAAAAPFAQTMASFFGDDGVLLKKFIFRIEPSEGLKKIEPIVQRVSAPPTARVELRLFFYFVFPLLLLLVLLLGVLVRSFPGPGDVEVLELGLGKPAHVAADRGSKQGLSLVADAKDASATLTYQAPSLDLAGVGTDGVGADPVVQALLPMPIDELRKKLEALSAEGSKEEKIFALNLDYMAKNMEGAEAERILTTTTMERRKISAVDFLRAKAHLISNEALRRKLTEPRVQFVGYGKGGARRELGPAASFHVGRYGFLVRDVAKGGRKDVKLLLYYDKVPSLFALKNILPDAFQRVFRLRRSSQRVVT
jgi:hypothetical protein